MGFTKITAALPPDRTFRIPLDLPRLGDGEPTVIVRHAGHGNDAFINANYKRQSPGGPQSALRDRMEREIDAAIYAETVIVGWEHIYDDGLKPSAFDRALVEEFMLALARDRPDQFYMITNLARMSSNFRNAMPTAEALGKG